MDTLFDNPTPVLASLSVGLCCMVIYFLLVVVGRWKVFVKAGKPGWAAIIPIYNMWVLLKIVGRPGWWIILFFIPFVWWIMSIVISFDVAEAFGHGIPYALGLFFFPFVFYLILGFGDDQYAGPPAGKSMARDWRD